MEPFRSLRVERRQGAMTLTMDRPGGNRLDIALVQEIERALDLAVQDEETFVIILGGRESFFCAGMDFEELVRRQPLGEREAEEQTGLYMNLLTRLATIPRIVISKVEGQVAAGGVGLVASSDLVIASPQSRFSLSEALWGLLPSCVLPYLIRRTGFQKAYALALTTQTVTAQEAHRIHLVDQLSDRPDEAIARLLPRLTKINSVTVGRLKSYCGKLWKINPEMEQLAIRETAALIREPGTIAAITEFVVNGKLPWED